MDEMEERPSAVIECPHCHVKVLPTANNICPACRENVLDTQGVDPNQVALTILESEELPDFCFSCSRYTERVVRVSGDEGISEVSDFSRDADFTSNVIIFLPQCESCGELEDPEPLHVDYESQKMTFVVHQGFRERVFQLRESRPEA